MAYSDAAERRRRCTYRFPEGHEREGERCKAYAMWGSPGQLCVAHGTEGRGPKKAPEDRVLIRRTIPKCKCEAYNFPHRPGGGLCQWPDTPDRKLTTPAGTNTGRGIPSIRWTPGVTETRNVVEAETVEAEAEKAPPEADDGAPEPTPEQPASEQPASE
jgi:hypothetical protein